MSSEGVVCSAADEFVCPEGVVCGDADEFVCPEGVVAGSPGQETLLSASTPLDLNWMKPGRSLLMWELIQLW